ncbi:M23 family metallopeptidase [Aestuariivita boseongensis]|uniref:M23 family metallopeptidase n=1 Tax=Aestuariivita boseongensis TaxID=1470562 RepID=UPI000682C20D|nr:M23 family metallopeptidase [Aestuariivita boseongensis]
MVLRVLLVLVAVGLAGCDRDDLYGRYDYYAPGVSYAVDIEMPPNAPFISEQFRKGSEIGTDAHPGLDVWAKLRTPILAAAGGTVTASYYEPAFGNRVEIFHGKDARGVDYKTVYMHLKERLVEEGATVARGQQIGTMGATGAMGMFVHLHFEVHEGADANQRRQVDPQLYWVRGPGKVTCFDPAIKVPEGQFRITYPVKCR